MTLKRPVHPVPPDVAHMLTDRGLRHAYEARPPYQRNDYLAWIERARREDTRSKRLAQTLDELAAVEGYVGMAWRPAEGPRA